jgi:hypothetical protein
MADLTRAQVKKNIEALQKRIAKDARARNSFLKDPAATLEKAGVALSADRAKALSSFVDKQLRIPGARVSGAAIRPSGAANEVEVTVSVGVKF